MNIDFVQSFEYKNRNYQRRVKLADSLPELIGTLKLRYDIYCDSNYTTPEHIKRVPDYSRFMDFIRQHNTDPYDGEYEVDFFDRFEEVLNPTIPQEDKLTKIIVSLEEDDSGIVELDDLRYSVVASERVVIDDSYIRDNPVGLTMEPDINIDWFREKQYSKGRLLSEAGRLVKKKGEPPQIVDALNRTMLHHCLYEKFFAPDSVIAVPMRLEKYYGGLGFRRLANNSFTYHKLDLNSMILLHLDMKRSKKILDLAGLPLIRNLVKLKFPRIDASRYAVQKFKESEMIYAGENEKVQ